MPFRAARVPALSAVAFTVALQQREHTDSFYRRVIFLGPGRELSALLAGSVSCASLLDCLDTRDFACVILTCRESQFVGLNLLKSVPVDDSVTSSASGTRARLPFASDGSEGSNALCQGLIQLRIPHLSSLPPHRGPVTFRSLMPLLALFLLESRSPSFARRPNLLVSRARVCFRMVHALSFVGSWRRAA